MLYEGKVHLITCHEGTNREQKYSSTLSLTLALNRVGGQCHAPAALPPGKRPGTQCTGGRVGPRAGLNGCGKISLLPGSDTRTAQPVATILSRPTGTLSRGYSGRGVAFKTHPRSTAAVKKRSGAIPLLPLWAFNVCSRVNFALPLPHFIPQGWPARRASTGTIQKESQQHPHFYSPLIEPKYRSTVNDVTPYELVPTALTTYKFEFRNLAATINTHNASTSKTMV